MVYIFYNKIKKVHLIRPLLHINRLEVCQLSRFWKLPLLIDVTNKFKNLKRNRLRYQILPSLKIFFNPKIESALYRFIETANFEKRYFNIQFERIKYYFQIQKIKNLKSKHFKIYKKEIFNFFPYEVQKLIYQYLLKNYFQKGLSYEIFFLLRNNLK
nr:hypothetical protein [Ostreobium sp. TRHA14-720]